MSSGFWKEKKVLVTGHTGFKGSWLSIWLQHLGAKVIGVSLDPPTSPSLYQQANVAAGITSLREDIRNGNALKQLFQQHQPEIVFHLAAQPLVRYSYKEPVETYETNVMGVLHVLEAIRSIDTVQATILITTDKCYENREWYWGYREIDPMGGYDPYSSSKGAAELLIASYRESYLPNIASVRAGNVIGGGDWAEDRIIPDIIRAFQQNKTVEIRNPHAVRPWQHVLEPLAGYMQLAEQLFNNAGEYAEAWNFGPKEEDAKPVQWIVEQMAIQWGNSASWKIDQANHPHEASYLKLDCSKARAKLNWEPKWSLQTALQKIVEWHKLESDTNNYKKICIEQIKEYMECEKR
ncbi:MAG: CDP-glucose 4,6-dehydratase [Candidatus Scalindua sp.]|nr:CDP-glucose 4,6-dehydratase [Candidatus Scalindua sp.]